MSLDSRSAVRQLRNIERKNYKKMSEGQMPGEAEKVSVVETPIELLDGASGGTEPAGALHFMTGSQLLSDDEMDKEMARVAEEMEKLDREAASLAKKEKLDAMQRELQLKRQKVKELRGMPLTDIAVRPKILATKIGDSSKMKLKVETGKPNSKIVGAEIHKDDAFDIEMLRKDDSLKSRVRKELKKLGLESGESSDISSSSESESEDDSSETEKRKKDKKKVNVKNQE